MPIIRFKYSSLTHSFSFICSVGRVFLRLLWVFRISLLFNKPLTFNVTFRSGQWLPFTALLWKCMWPCAGRATCKSTDFNLHQSLLLNKRINTMSRASKPASEKYNSDLKTKKKKIACHLRKHVEKHLSRESLLVSWFGASTVSELRKQQLTTSISHPLFHQRQGDRHRCRGMIKCEWRLLTISICPARTHRQPTARDPQSPPVSQVPF